jgi:hypothetical protein
MKHRRQPDLKQFLLATGTILFFLPILMYSWQYFLRPPRTMQQQVLFQGIVYKRSARQTPRPIVIHTVAIDLSAPGLKVFVTPGQPTQDETETNARTTSEFLKEFGLQLAINSNYFYEFRENTPWDYYPHRRDRVNNLGQAISNGYTYSDAADKFPALCFAADNRAQIAKTGACPPGTTQAVAGHHLLVVEGKPTTETFTSDLDRKPYPCVAVAIDRSGKKLWLIAIDGKQPFYSEGVRLSELAEIVRELGAQTAINLDGGGSTALVTREKEKAKVLNAPIHTKIPMRERPVANHLGFYALPP